MKNHSFNSSVPVNQPDKSLAASLVTLGFDQARYQNFGWLTLCRTAKPLLESICTSFSKECILSPNEADKYKSLRHSTIIPDSALFEAAELLSNAELKLLRVREEKKLLLETAKHRLELLRRQEERLHDAVNQKRRLARAALSPKSLRSRLSRLAQDDNSESDSSCHLVDELKEAFQGISYAHHLDPKVDTYVQKERALSEELFVSAKQVIIGNEVNIAPTSAAQRLSVHELVKAYGDIKADQCLFEARLARNNAILAALSLNKFAFLETSSSSMQSLTKDLQVRGKIAVEAKSRHVSEQAKNSLWSKLNEITYVETLRRQNAIVDFMQLSAELCFLQRMRLLCFRLVISGQAALYQSLYDKLSNLASNPATKGSPALTLPKTPILSGESTNREFSGSPNIHDLSRTSSGDHLFTSACSMESLESKTFNLRIQQLTDTLDDFLSTAAFQDGIPRFESHHDFITLVEEVENVLAHNTGILNTVLRKRESRLPSTAAARNWAKFVSSMGQ